MSGYEQIIQYRPETKLMDRRISRTRTALADGLVQVMAAQPWDRINVQQICDKSGVARSTFYVHFNGKEDLLDLCFERLEDELTVLQPDRGLDAFGTLNYLPNLIAHVNSHCELFRLNALSSAGQRIFKRFESLVQRLNQREFQACQKLQLSADQTIFINGGIFAMLEAWNENGCRDAQSAVIKRIDDQVRRLLPTND